ncbi:MAG: alpha-amylase family protein [Planctomycetota bacterium]
MNRTYQIPMVFLLVTAVSAFASVGDRPAPIGGLTTTTHKRPDWMKQGIIMAGNWSSITHRKHESGQPWTQSGFGLSDDEAEILYRKEISAEMADRLKEKGVTFVMIPLWSGIGSYKEEFPGMEDSKRFAELIHARGMRVGVYIHQGSLSREFLADRPDAYDWLAWPSFESSYTKPPPKEKAPGYTVYRNHDGYQKFMRKIIHYAIKEVKADLVHFDNYVFKSGLSPWAIEDFRKYLRVKYTPAILKEHFGGEDLKEVSRLAHAKIEPACLEWRMFQAWMFGESYRRLSDYARSLNPEVATEMNAGGISVGFRDGIIDLSQMLPYGDAYWHEQTRCGWKPNRRKLYSGIRTYKLARLYNQCAFTYTPARLTCSEALAFNNDGMGCPYWFMYARLNWAVTATKTADETLAPETRFYNENRGLFNQGDIITDVAVLRGRATNINGPMEAISNAYLFEQAMITEHIPFEIIFDQHLDDLSKYRAVALPDVRMMEDGQIKKLLDYVESDGGLVVTDRTASQDRWRRPRKNGLGRFFKKSVNAGGESFEQRGKGRMVYTRIARPEKFSQGSLPLNSGELAEAVVKAMGGRPTFRTDAPLYVGMEYVRQKQRVLIHLLDYSEGAAASRPIRIWTSPVLGKVADVRMISPRRGESKLPFAPQDRGVQITVGNLNVYAVVIVDLAQLDTSGQSSVLR